jgi:hypothetical protein
MVKLALTIEGCKNSCATKNISFHSYVMNIHNFDPKPVHVLHNPAMNRVVLPQGLTFLTVEVIQIGKKMPLISV